MKYSTEAKIGKISDQTLIKQLSQNVFMASRQRRSLIIEFFYYIFRTLLSVASYIGKIFLRRNLGERTYGVFSIILVYLLILFVQGCVAIWPSIESEWNSLDQSSFFDDKPALKAIDKIVVLGIIASTDKDTDALASMGIWYFFREAFVQPPWGWEIRLFWWVIIALSIHQFVNKWIRKKDHNNIHSYFRGESIFFERFIGKKLGRFTINQRFVWMIIDPIFLMIISFPLAFWLESQSLVIILRISAVCLFLEEYSVYSENRKMVLDVLDSQIDAEYIASIQQKSQQVIDHNHNSEGNINPDSFNKIIQ